MKKLIIICFMSLSLSLSGCIPLVAHQIIQGLPKIGLAFCQYKEVKTMQEANSRLEQQYWDNENEKIRKEKEEKEKNKDIVSKSKG
jgi:hypothetical protein|tara:strand:+ start:57 stop:314 length:258 start_codon:yes stop_codon:yes gene_type:complete